LGKIADKLNLEYELNEFDLDGLLQAAKNNEIDMAVSPLTITAEREKLFDFTHSYFTTGLSIAVPNKVDNSFWGITQNLFSSQFVEVILGILLILFFVGLLVWLFERKKNKDEFGEGMSKGLGASFWWAAVTLTTVGYGDKAPKTTGGRIIALIWMFSGLVMISGFTAAIASALTVNQLDVGINSLNDLYDVRVGTVKTSSSEEFLQNNGLSYITTNSIEDGIELIKQNKIDAFVYDAPILKYSIKSQNISNEIRVLPIILDPINYAFALPANSNLREPINRALLEVIDNIEWQNTVDKYIGR
jgi:polar amino acid transport system substrate-binding protein